MANGISNRRMAKMLGPAAHPRLPSAIAPDAATPSPHPIREARLTGRGDVMIARGTPGADVGAARAAARAGVAAAVQQKAGMIRDTRMANRAHFAVEHPVIAAQRAMAGTVRSARLTGRGDVMIARGTPGADVGAARTAARAGVQEARTTRQTTIAEARANPQSARSEQNAARSAHLIAKGQRLKNRASRY